MDVEKETRLGIVVKCCEVFLIFVLISEGLLKHV